MFSENTVRNKRNGVNEVSQSQQHYQMVQSFSLRTNNSFEEIFYYYFTAATIQNVMYTL